MIPRIVLAGGPQRRGAMIRGARRSIPRAIASPACSGVSRLRSTAGDIYLFGPFEAGRLIDPDRTISVSI